MYIDKIVFLVVDTQIAMRRRPNQSPAPTVVYNTNTVDASLVIDPSKGHLTHWLHLHATCLRVYTGALWLATLVAFVCACAPWATASSTSHTAATVVNATNDMQVKEASVDQAAAALSAAICAVAAYHYGKLLSIREDMADENVPPNDLTEWQMDIVRYSDWAITLPALALELQLLTCDNAQNAIDHTPLPAFLLCIMVGFGALARILYNEGHPHWLKDKAMWLSLACLAVAWTCLALALFLDQGLHLSNGNHPYGWSWFVWPWFAYGVVSGAAIILRTYASPTEDHNAYPWWLALVKDDLYGALDLWSKGFLALWAAAKTLHLYP